MRSQITLIIISFIIGHITYSWLVSTLLGHTTSWSFGFIKLNMCIFNNLSDNINKPYIIWREGKNEAVKRKQNIVVAGCMIIIKSKITFGWSVGGSAENYLIYCGVGASLECVNSHFILAIRARIAANFIWWDHDHVDIWWIGRRECLWQSHEHK